MDRGHGVVAVSLMVVVFVGFLQQRAYGGQGPRLNLKESAYYGGRVKEGEKVRHAFELLNTGDMALTLQDIRTDCGCTTAEFDRSIPPGGTGQVTLLVDTKGYEGSIRRTAVIQTDDPLQKEVTVHIEADVLVPIRLSSGHVVFKGVYGQEMSKSIEILAQEKMPLRLEVNDFDLEGRIRFSIEEPDPGRRFLIRVTSLAGAPRQFSGTLKLKTNYPDNPEIAIPIRARFSDVR